MLFPSSLTTNRSLRFYMETNQHKIGPAERKSATRGGVYKSRRRRASRHINYLCSDNDRQIINNDVSIWIFLYYLGFGIVLPFLKPSCGIRVINENLITPLHKSIINMNNPTMGFIGFLFNTLVNRVFDLQVGAISSTYKTFDSL